MKKYLSILLICFLFFCCSVPAFASTNTTDAAAPIPPNMDSTQYNSYLIVETSKYYYCYLYHDADWLVYYNEPQNVLKFYSNSESPKIVYDSIVQKQSYDNTTANNGWGTFDQRNHTTLTHGDGTPYQTISITPGDNYATSHDIHYGTYNADTFTIDLGAVFFSAIPPLVVATEEALSLFQTQTIQTIMTIVLCGVSCLALMIGLSLLHKVLLRFLNR